LSCVSGAKRKENELRRVFAVKLKEAKTEADAAMERLRRQHHTEMNTLRQAREVSQHHTITTQDEHKQ
jgi:LPS O-antigen subunit length determinant protein (WzzB/FepE family)